MSRSASKNDHDDVEEWKVFGSGSVAMTFPDFKSIKISSSRLLPNRLIISNIISHHFSVEVLHPKMSQCHIILEPSITGLIFYL